MTDSGKPDAAKRDFVKTAAPAIDGTVAVLDVLSASSWPLQLSEICEKTGIAQATAHRIIQAMLSHRLIALAPGRRKTYVPGSRLFQLASAVFARQPFVPHFYPIAEILKNEIHRSIFLSLPIGNQVVILARLDAPASTAFNAYVGRTMPMHLSASGKAILAARPLEDQLTYLRDEGLAAPGMAADLPALAQDLQRSARLGYAVSLNEIQLDVGCVAAPVVNGRGEPVAAISACFTGEALSLQSARVYSKNVVQAARQLSSHIL